MAKITLNDLTSNYGSQALHNANNDTIEDNLNNKVLYRDNPDGEPNSMQQELDMNSNRIINMADGVNNTDAVSVSQLNSLIAGTGNVSNVIQARESQLGSQAVARVFTLSGIVYALGVNTLAVYRNGQRLEKSVDYLESSASTVTLTFDPNANDRFVFITNALSTSVAGTTDAITHTEDSTVYNLGDYLRNKLVLNVDDFLVGDGDGAGGGTDDSAALQALLDTVASGSTVEKIVFNPSKIYRLDSKIKFQNGDLDRPLIIDGQWCKLDFSNRTTGRCIDVGDTDDSFNNSTIMNFDIVGTSTTDCFHLNPFGGTTAPDLARFKLHNIRLSSFQTGITAAYMTAGSFRDIVISQCSLGMDLGSQVNNFLFDGVRIANCDRFMEIQNCEGLEFNSPLFQNISDATQNTAILMRQSEAVMNNPYFEGLSNTSAAVLLGGSGDTEACSLIMFGGKMPGGNFVRLSQNLDHLVYYEGVKSKNSETGIICEDDNFKSIKEARFSSTVYGEQGRGKELFRVDVSTKESYGAATTFEHLPAEKALRVDSGGSYTLPISTSLTPGNLYTLCIEGRYEASTTIQLQEYTGGFGGTQNRSNSLTNPLDDSTGEIKRIYIPFKAVGDSLRLNHAGFFDLRLVALNEGCVFNEYDLSGYNKLYASAIPTTQAWELGDVLFNSAPSVGQPGGWSCTAAGTPGTWTAWANL